MHNINLASLVDIEYRLHLLQLRSRTSGSTVPLNLPPYQIELSWNLDDWETGMRDCTYIRVVVVICLAISWFHWLCRGCKGSRLVLLFYLLHVIEFLVVLWHFGGVPVPVGCYEAVPFIT